MKKHIAIKLPGIKGIQDIDIKPGTAAGDILAELNLEDYQLRRPGSDDPNDTFGLNENVFKQVEDGEKLEASTEAVVG
ncbi:MAG: hypothetical protein ABEK17_01230 [Candidatus Aenigmatarchaeota archaeon]